MIIEESEAAATLTFKGKNGKRHFPAGGETGRWAPTFKLIEGERCNPVLAKICRTGYSIMGLKIEIF